jgi:uncharacterized protein (UPF0335 family)
MSDIAADQLASLIERIERLEEEIRDRNSDKSEVFKEAKGAGFDVAIMRKLIARRRMEPSARLEQDAILELYEEALVRARAHVRAA